MKIKKEKKTLTQGKAMHPFIPLLVMVVLCTIISYFVVPGAYDRETVDGVTRVVADSYHAVERTPVSLFNMFRSIPEGLTATANMMFCIMLIAGVVEIYKYTNVVGALINSVLRASKRFNSLTIIAIVMIVFFIFGGILGWSEHIIPFVPIIISLAISLGYDALVGMAISGFACLIAFASAPFNMFTVGTSHTIAELPMFSGWELRLISLIVICLMALLWTLRYARKIKNNPELSLVKDIDNSSLILPVDEEVAFTPARKLSTLVLLVSIVINIVGILQWGWSYTHMATSFLMGGVVVVLLNRVSLEKAIDLIVDGCKGAFVGAAIIGVARAVQWTMTEGGLIDPLVHGLSSLMQGASTYISTVGMFLANFFINALIPSGSGQATAVMPIMVPLADMLGITRQTAVLAFQYGDGISNTFWFTNGTLLIYLGLAKVPLKKWYKFILPLHAMYFVLEFVFLFIAVQIGYGPF